MIPTAYTTFNNYFMKKRVMMMSLAQSLIGLGTMLYPIVMQKLLDWYGFRGCLLILAGINAHSILGMQVMHPVEWHIQKISSTKQELENLQIEHKNNINEMKDNNENIHNKLDIPRWHSKLSLKSRSKLSLHRPSLDHIKNLQIEENLHNSRRTSSLASLGNWTGPVIVSDAYEQDKSSSNKW